MTPQGEDTHKVVRLPGDRIATPQAPVPTRSTSTLHTAAVAGMALSAFIGIAAVLVFISVRWPGDTGRFVMAVCVGAAISFLACASTAVFSAARDSYPRRGSRRDES
ncbi:MAG: hypothetical protein ACRDJJ_09000 [Actinomycetota bacterium]